MNYTIGFVVMAVAFLVAILVIGLAVHDISDKVDIIHELDLKFIKEIHESQCRMDKGWQDSLDGWKETLDIIDELLTELKKAVERMKE